MKSLKQKAESKVFKHTIMKPIQSGSQVQLVNHCSHSFDYQIRRLNRREKESNHQNLIRIF